MSLRIVLSAPYAWPEVRRGGERYLHELAGGLARAGHRVRVLSAAQSAGRTTIRDVPVRHLRRRGARLATRFGHLAPEVAFGVQALGLAGFARADVWHGLSPSDALAAALASRVRPRLRSVYTDLGVPTRETRELRSDLPLYQRAVRSVDAYVCISRFAGDQLRRDWHREAAVIPCGVDLTAFQPADIRHPKPALLFASDPTDPRKDLSLLLDAVALLRGQVPEVELWLVGPGDPTALLAAGPAAARDAVTISRLVELDELRRLYGRAWVTVLPSHREAFGLVVVESLASGTPAVVLADSGGPLEILDGREGVGVVVAGTPDALADGCLRAIELARSPETVESCRAAAAPYDWDTCVVPQIEAVYSGTAL